MSETDNIARMAEIVSKEIFGVFGWTPIGPRNQNWQCRTDSHSTKNGTHPSDVVFEYEDPYSNKRIYVNIDLKSYAAGTIKTDKIAKAIRSLAHSTECANKSNGWSDLYARPDIDWTAVGMLFIYNHDNEFDKDFKSLLGSVNESNYQLAPRRRMYILGPERISYLATVANDIKVMRGSDPALLPKQLDCYFYYPHLNQVKSTSNHSRAATLDMLLGPWQILGYLLPNGRQGIILYYAESGDSDEDFMYLIDFLFHYQLIEDHPEISIRMPIGAPSAVVNFQRAIERYIDQIRGSKEIKDRLKTIKCENTPKVVYNFNQIQLGMRDE